MITFIIIIVAPFLFYLIYLWERPDTSNYIKTEAILSGIYSFGKRTYHVRFMFTNDKGKEISVLAEKPVGVLFIKRHKLGDKFTIKYNPYNYNMIKF